MSSVEMQLFDKGIASALRVAYRGAKAVGGDALRMAKLKAAARQLRASGDIQGARQFDDALKRYEQGDPNALDRFSGFSVIGRTKERAFDNMLRD